jgi:hypothetical protein
MGSSGLYPTRRPKKCSALQQAQFKEAQATRNHTKHQKENLRLTNGTKAKQTTAQQLRNTTAELIAIQELLQQSTHDIAVLAAALDRTETKLIRTQAQLNESRDHSATLYHDLRIEHRKTQRLQRGKIALQKDLKETKSLLSTSHNTTRLAITDRDNALTAEASAQLAFRRLLDRSDSDLAKYKRLVDDSRQKIRTLQMKNLRTLRSRDKAHDKAKTAAASAKSKTHWKLMKSGAYTPEARAMARMLVKAGCSQGQVGAVIKYVGKQAGLEVQGKLSRRTVQRALIEGGVALRLQICYEMADADGKRHLFWL